MKGEVILRLSIGEKHIELRDERNDFIRMDGKIDRQALYAAVVRLQRRVGDIYDTKHAERPAKPSGKLLVRVVPLEMHTWPFSKVISAMEGATIRMRARILIDDGTISTIGDYLNLPSTKLLDRGGIGHGTVDEIERGLRRLIERHKPDAN